MALQGSSSSSISRIITHYRGDDVDVTFTCCPYREILNQRDNDEALTRDEVELFLRPAGKINERVFNS